MIDYQDIGNTAEITVLFQWNELLISAVLRHKINGMRTAFHQTGILGATL